MSEFFGRIRRTFVNSNVYFVFASNNNKKRVKFISKGVEVYQ